MMTQSRRLPAGGVIDRGSRVPFSFDGKSYAGHHGDTLASALLANGVRLIGRSFKYHRPRGLLTAGSDEPNGLVELRAEARREPNTKATTVELFAGLDARSQNRWPSLAFDLMAVNQLASKVFVAGFYYKTFMWPASFWEKLYEPLIRRAAGLGRVAESADPDSYEKLTAYCDVLVIGSGPAGLAAALTAGRSGARVILAEEDFRLGGRLLSDRREVAGAPSAVWVMRTEAELESLPEITVLKRTSVFGAYDGGVYAAVEHVADHLAAPEANSPRQRLWRIVAKRCVLAAGALERPIAFGNNDLPGVMMASAVRTYLNRFGVAPGKRAVVYANNDDAARTVTDLLAAGCEVAAVVDARGDAQTLQQAAQKSGARIIVGGSVRRAHGRREVEGCEIADLSGKTLDISCDLVAVSSGWNPTIQLTSHLGNRPVWSETIAGFLPGVLPRGMAVAGAACGAFDLEEALTVGARQGREAADAAGFVGTGFDAPTVDPERCSVHGVGPWRRTNKVGKAFVDFQNDVTDSDVELAAREGFRSVEHLKRYTTLGMATDQGKTANVVGLAMMAEITGRSIPDTGTTLARPPFAPVAIGALAGAHRHKEFKPTRLPPSHFWAEEQGAVFVETGQWTRAAYFPRAGETDWFQSAVREVNTVRTSVGVYDASTLGKIDVKGADAAQFLDNVFINTFSRLPVGRISYGMMLREDGIAMDDGTTTRFADDYFYMTTSTLHAASVMRHLELCKQWHWPSLDVTFTSVTDQWAKFAIAGPNSRDVLHPLVDADHDISDEGLPHLHAKEVSISGGVEARLFRLSFSGERAFELAVPARYGDATIRAIMASGQPYGICPYGAEALAIMRIEKGYPSAAELNGHTTAQDLGLGGMMSKKKDFIGRIMSGREALREKRRPSLVGLKPVDVSERLRGGMHFVAKGKTAVAAHDDGYITSAAYSPSNRSWIAIGLLADGQQRFGEIVSAVDPVRNLLVDVEVVKPVFVDPEGSRVHG